MTPSKILFYFCISFIIGVAIDSIIKIPQFILWIFLIAAVLLIFTFLFSRHCEEPAGDEAIFIRRLRLLRPAQGGPRNDELIVFGFCILFFILGILRNQISWFNIENNQLKEFNDKGEIILIGTIIGEPDIRDTFQKLKVRIHQVKLLEGQIPPKAGLFNLVEKPDGIILVTVGRYPEYKYLDKVKIIGKLETPQEFEDFSYKNYLLKDGIYSVMGFPKISALGGPASGGELIGNGNYSDYSISQRIYSGILFFKQKLRESIRRNFLPPHSSILEGTILGDSGALGQDLKNKLNITGLRHIIAVSGTHVVILSAILMSLFLSLGLWRGQAFYFSISFVCLYVILTGMSASGVRAGIMGGLYLLAQKLGRQSMGPRPVVIAGALMLSLNPLLLFYDVGFQLSFLAVLGLIYFEPIIKIFLYKILAIFKSKNKDRINKTDKDSKANNILSIISTTFAAQIFTLPIMIYNFGNVSFVSPITNVLVLPIVYWLMIFGFLSSILGVVSHFLGWIFFLPCWLLLFYFVKIIDIFSQPWAVKTIENIHWIWLAVSYLLLGFAVRISNKIFKKSILR